MAVGGLSASHENQKNSVKRILEGDKNLIYFLTNSNNLMKQIINIDSTKLVSKNSNSLNLTN